MTRMRAAVLLMSSTVAFAQSPQIAHDQKQLQGIWRVSNARGSAEAEFFAGMPTHLVFRGNKFFFVTRRLASAEAPYKLNPNTEPKQIDLLQATAVHADRQELERADLAIIPGIYALDRDRLKIHFRNPGPRPDNFSTVREGVIEYVLTLDRDTSPAALNTVRGAQAMLAMRELEGVALSSYSWDGQPSARAGLYVKLVESSGDAILASVAPPMKAFSRVDGLQLKDGKVTDTGLASLAGMNNIEQINLEGTVITDAGLTHLKNMTSLQLLTVTGTKVTNAGIAGLKKSLPNLRVIHRSHVESDSLKAITNSSGIGYFDADGKLVAIHFTRVQDSWLLELKDQLEIWKPTLKSIDLTDCCVTDRGLRALAGLTSLAEVTLEGTDVTVAGVKSLQCTVPNLKVKH